jgi:hypothetical protein
MNTYWLKYWSLVLKTPILTAVRYKIRTAGLQYLISLEPGTYNFSRTKASMAAYSARPNLL